LSVLLNSPVAVAFKESPPTPVPPPPPPPPFRAKRPADLGRILDFKHQKLHAEVARGARELGPGRDRRRVGQYGDPPRLRDEFMQDFEPLYVQLRGENAHPCRIAAQPR